MSTPFLRFCLIVVALTCAPSAGASDAVRAAIEALIPNATDIAVAPSPVPGVSEVVVGINVFYVSDDGSFILGGPLVRASDGENLTELRVAGARARLLAAHKDLRTFDYPSASPAHAITVITDIDCPYCRRFHNDMAEYNAAGFDVRYIMLPRAGTGSVSYQKAVYAACAKDPEAAMTDAMNGKPVDAADCDHPIDQHMAIVQELQINSTPSIVFEDGRLLRGLRSASELEALAGDGAAD